MDEYLAKTTDPKDQVLVKRMNQIIAKVLPDAEVRLSYGLVGYFQPKQICFFGINKQTISFYPTNKPIEHFQKEIAPYLSGKTTLKFPKDVNAIPVQLIQKIAVWNLEN
ncbi:iron chaperone [Companilactobacillus huachuanensis]|uniref:Iron chaperone n=1 Tax=Companilactobacillus huachuanensis TaxID=2559914 RepID=A0ABW1RKZ8_9LACO|nr:DUF1801 domain-containing protein [Companilactobacillus huachuanensis]